MQEQKRTDRACLPEGFYSAHVSALICVSLIVIQQPGHSSAVCVCMKHNVENTAQAHARCCITSLHLCGGWKMQRHGQGRRIWEERLTIEGAEEGSGVAEVYDSCKEERLQPQGLPQASFTDQPAVETENAEQWDYLATVTYLQFCYWMSQKYWILPAPRTESQWKPLAIR